MSFAKSTDEEADSTPPRLVVRGLMLTTIPR